MAAKKIKQHNIDAVEKRRAIRQDLQLLISYVHGNAKFSKFSYDLSPTGMFIESITPLAAGTSISLIFELPHNRIVFEIQATVTRINEDKSSGPVGMGVKFHLTNPDVAEKLKTATEYFAEFSKRT